MPDYQAARVYEHSINVGWVLQTSSNWLFEHKQFKK